MIQGIVNVIKPTGMSSHDVVSQLRRIYGIKKVGHAGTLDPLAAGVLPIYLGNATRLIEYGDSDIKTYHAEFILGIATDTEDGTGQIVEQKEVPLLTMDEIQYACNTFLGQCMQQPSRYSSIHVNGVKAYKLARQQQDFILSSRPIQIYDIQMLTYCNQRGRMIVRCSKGTYIRSLIRDLGKALGTCACMTYLVRTEAGVFHIEDAITLEALSMQPEKYVLPLDTAIQHLHRLDLSAAQCKDLVCGRAVSFKGNELTQNMVIRIYDPTKRLMGIGTFDQAYQLIRPHKMFIQV